MTTVDFFGLQHHAQRQTRWLVAWFALAVVALIGAAWALARFAASVTDIDGHRPSDLALFALVAGGSVLVIGFAMLLKTQELSAGGAVVARMLGGRPVDASSSDPHELMLRNVVEEMAIASGVPVPDVYVIDDETGLNAFAAGWTTRDAAITVTRGCLERLDRDQLQGVIAHEFSHVFHGDMRLNIRLMGVLFGITCIASTGELLLRSMGRVRTGRRNDPGAAFAILGLGLLVFGSIGAFFAGLIRAAISRQREYLADASAVAYTRNPHGIGGALAKIGGFGSVLHAPAARQASHMFFADGVTRWFGGLGATHPPIEQRIERVLPGFLAELRRGGEMVAAAERTPAPMVSGPVDGAVAFGAASAAGALAGALPRVRSDAIAGHVGRVEPRHVETAQNLLADLPLDVVGAARDPARAPALVYALLLDRDAAAGQDAVLQRCEAAPAHDARSLAAALQKSPPTVRLPLLGIAVPALRRLPGPARSRLLADAEALARADGVITPFEFALLKTVRRHVAAPGAGPLAPAARPIAINQALPEAELMLSVLARAAGDANAAAAAFGAGAAVLMAPTPLRMRDAAGCSLDALDQALDRLAQVTPFGKRLLLTACAHAVAADGHVEPAEGELLRAIAESLECPLPPLWAGAMDGDADDPAVAGPARGASSPPADSSQRD
jgi:Zn-dependent protease with chaperone function